MDQRGQTTKAITLKGSAEIVTEFFAFGINNILYQRGIYPPESFTRVSKYGLGMVVTADEKLKAYLKNVLEQLSGWLLDGLVQKLVLVVAGVDSKTVLERWVFDVIAEPPNAQGERVSTKDEKEIMSEIQAIMRQITASVSFLPLLNEACAFDLLLYTDKDLAIPQAWEESDPRFVENSTQVRLRSFTTKSKETKMVLGWMGQDMDVKGRFNSKKVTQVDQMPILMNWVQGLVQLYGIRTLLVLCGTNMLSGLISIDLFAVDYMFKDEFKLSPSIAQVSTTTLMLPWAFKPLWGLITDTIAIRGYHRKPFYLLCGCMAYVCTCLLGMNQVTYTYQLVLLVLLVRSVGYAFIDVIIDAVLAEQARKDRVAGAQNLQSLASFHKAFGVVLASLLKGPLLTELGPRLVFTVMSFVMPLPFIVLSCIMVEEHSATSDTIANRMRRQTRLLAKSFKSPLVWRPALFLLLSISLSPTIIQVYFYFATNELHFSPNFIASLSLVGAITAMLTTLLYQAKMKHTPFRSIFIWSQIGIMCVSSTTLLLVTRTNLTLGIPDKAFVIGEDVAIVIVKYMQIMPITVLCAKLCPEGVEGTMFAGFDSIMNGSYLISGYLGAVIAQHAGITENNFTNLWAVQLIIIGCKLLPFLWLFLLISDEVNTLTSTDQNLVKPTGHEIVLPRVDATATVADLQIRHV
ncbi:folate-Biopterin Transporter (FBT) family [Thraustotheca clavata]|uniref:Folate-Biopterin Transporter (FBT) family n=1 Tax=Thraustotheca clavata TaxID=74557 RepID=A0A1V9ZD43_9STRA|nr:folate-Biopterin Transporter (FBT) family [Thraustotheca clavata]